MTDDRGATALTERLQTIPVPSSYEEWLARLGASYEDDALAILGEHGVFLPDGRTLERLREARAWVAMNLAVWDDDDGTLVGAAVADIFRKVLNVIDTGNPMTALAEPTPEGGS